MCSEVGGHPPCGKGLPPAELEVHDLDQLIEKAGLVESIHREANLKGIYSRVADMWHPELRYRARNPSQEEAERFYREVVQVYRWLIDQAV
jgi:hypothetical protein